MSPPKTLWLKPGLALLLIACFAGRASAQNLQKELATPVPVERAPINCAVLSWEYTPSRPLLTLVCPPEDVFAPLRVYLKLSHSAPKGKARDYQKIAVQPGELTKMRSAETEALIWLKVQEDGKAKPTAQWMPFDEIVKVGLFDGARRSRPTFPDSR